MKYGISMEESMDAVWNKYGRKYGISTEYPVLFFRFFLLKFRKFEISILKKKIGK